MQGVRLTEHSSAHLINTRPASHRHFLRAEEAAAKSAQSQISATPGDARGCPRPHPGPNTTPSVQLLGPREGLGLFFKLLLQAESAMLLVHVMYDGCCGRVCVSPEGWICIRISENMEVRVHQKGLKVLSKVGSTSLIEKKETLEICGRR